MTTELLTQLGRYQLKRVIGRGAMGLVYEGLDPRLDRKVAVKTILKRHLLDEALASEYSARFVREAQAAGRLNHPNIVTVFDFGEQDDVAYLVMEFVHGRELAAHFEDNDFFDLPQAVRIVCELLDALGYAHDHGIVHRDVKPANVMIDRTGRVKLADFGVARLSEGGTERTQPGTMVGTLSYMSPEQIQGLAVGSRTDLFAVGVVLYQFLTRQKPFTGGGQWTIQKKIVQDEPVPPSFANRSVPPVFDGIVRRALAKDPEQRYASAAEFAADLQRAFAALPAEHGPPPTDPDATVVQPSRPAHSRPLEQPLQPSAPSSSPPPSGADSPAQTLVMPSPSISAPLPAPAAAARPAAPAEKVQAVARGPMRRAWMSGGLALAVLLGLMAWRVLSPADPATLSAPERPATPTATQVATPAPPAADPVAAPPAAVLPLGRDSTKEPLAVSPAPAAAQAAPPLAVAVPAPPRSELQDSADTTAATPRARPSPPKPQGRTAAPTSPPAADARCSDLLQRVQLGETLAPEALELFQKECQR